MNKQPVVMVYVGLRCQECQGSGKTASISGFGFESCHRCNGDRFIKVWQPASEFMLEMGRLVEVEVQPYITNT